MKLDSIALISCLSSSLLVPIIADNKALPLYEQLSLNSTIHTTPSTQDGFYDANYKLSGSLPSSLGDLTSLTSLVIAFNVLQNTLPTSIGQLQHMVELNLGFNGFTGTIPTSIGFLSQLTSMSLQYNTFNGTIPSAIGFLRALTGLYLDNGNYPGNNNNYFNNNYTYTSSSSPLSHTTSSTTPFIRILNGSTSTSTWFEFTDGKCTFVPVRCLNSLLLLYKNENLKELPTRMPTVTPSEKPSVMPTVSHKDSSTSSSSNKNAVSADPFTLSTAIIALNVVPIEHNVPQPPYTITNRSRSTTGVSSSSLMPSVATAIPVLTVILEPRSTWLQPANAHLR
eukprot:gene2413-4683_t